MKKKLNVYFHGDQLKHKPVYEWAFGEKLSHPETTTRADNILAALKDDPDAYALFTPEKAPLQMLRDIHDRRLISLYKAACNLPEGETFYPSLFPKRNRVIADEHDIRHSGYFCFDSGTPLASTTWLAATWSAACADSAARLIELGTDTAAYALCRPPGHHATRDLFGGYCYFNNAAICASRLRKHGRVAIIDIDFHHGNGTQGIFYSDPEVLFVSIHGDPKEFYPFYWGHERESGRGAGMGFNINIPIPEGCDGQEYLRVLSKKALLAIKKFAPAALVVSAGFDTYREDPIGRFKLETADFHHVGEALGKLKLPTVIVQEGGYCTDKLGANVSSFLTGFSCGARRDK